MSTLTLPSPAITSWQVPLALGRRRTQSTTHRVTLRGNWQSWRLACRCTQVPLSARTRWSGPKPLASLWSSTQGPGAFSRGGSKPAVARGSTGKRASNNEQQHLAHQLVLAPEEDEAEEEEEEDEEQEPEYLGEGEGEDGGLRYAVDEGDYEKDEDEEEGEGDEAEEEDEEEEEEQEEQPGEVGAFYRRTQRRSELLRNSAGAAFSGAGAGPEAAPGSELVEEDLRLAFMESIMEHSRCVDPEGAESAFCEMELAGLEPGPRAHHGVLTAYAQADDVDGAMRAFLRGLWSSERLLLESFVAMARLFGKHGLAKKGEDVLSMAEENNYNSRVAWLALVEELWNAGATKAANELFFKGCTAGLRPADELSDLLVHGNCKRGEYGRAVDVISHMMNFGRNPHAFHYNCLIMAMAEKETAETDDEHARGDPSMAEMALDMLENMTYDVVDALYPESAAHLPTAETYNWVLQTIARKDPTRWDDALDQVVCEMVERKVMPNQRTYELLIEGYSRLEFGASGAIRFFKGLRNLGSLKGLNQPDLPPIDGWAYNPMSIFVRHLARTGHTLELVEVLEACVRDQAALPDSAMLQSRHGRRTFVTSWMEPQEVEPDYGAPVDYAQRFEDEGGLEGNYGDWRKHKGGTYPWFVRQDLSGYWLPPAMSSYRRQSEARWKEYCTELYRKLSIFGTAALEPSLEPTTLDVWDCMQRVKREIVDKKTETRRPQAASKMLVAELRAELAGQGLPTDGRRPDLYKRVQKARALNRARGRPLWLPPLEIVPDKPDPRLDALLKSLSLQHTYTDKPDGPFAFVERDGPLGFMEKDSEGVRKAWLLNWARAVGITVDDEPPEGEGKGDDEEDEEEAGVVALGEEEEDDDDDEEADADDDEDGGGVGGARAGGSGSGRGSDEDEDEEELAGGLAGGMAEGGGRRISTGGVVRRGGRGGSAEEGGDGLQLGEETVDEAEDGHLAPAMVTSALLKEIQGERPHVEEEIVRGRNYLRMDDKDRKRFLEDLEVTMATTITNVWGHHWEDEETKVAPPKWSPAHELDLGCTIFDYVLALGQQPSKADCGVLIRRAMEVKAPSTLAYLLKASHKLGFVFGMQLYEEAVEICLDKHLREVAAAILTDMESAGVPAPDELLKRALEDPLPDIEAEVSEDGASLEN